MRTFIQNISMYSLPRARCNYLLTFFINNNALLTLARRSMLDKDMP